ncbi:hypothetical protein GALL_311250 [mine drainage metagenome]|uniref:Uncharacterized protein n=1 Tax=mine drainage metagenome TaxID=410659 RepID=A0A1J5QTP4_9ZZZZ
MVTGPTVAPGSWVHAGQAVVELAPADTALQLVAPLAASVGSLAAGAAAQVELGGGRVVRGARLMRVERDATGAARAVFALAAGPFVPPGTSARVEMTLPLRRNVLLAPDAALAFARPCSARHENTKLWIWTAEGNARELSVVAGPGDGRHTEIVAGDVKPGDLAIIGWKAPPAPDCAQPPAAGRPSTIGRPGPGSSKPSRP